MRFWVRRGVGDGVVEARITHVQKKKHKTEGLSKEADPGMCG